MSKDIVWIRQSAFHSVLLILKLFTTFLHFSWTKFTTVTVLLNVLLVGVPIIPLVQLCLYLNNTNTCISIVIVNRKIMQLMNMWKLSTYRAWPSWTRPSRPCSVGSGMSRTSTIRRGGLSSRNFLVVVLLPLQLLK